MRNILPALLLPLCACAGGPVTTDAELEWGLADVSAKDQEYAAQGDAKVVGLLGQVQAGVVALGEAVAASGGPPVPSEVAAASAAIGQHAPPEAAQRPDPATRPAGGPDWFGILEGVLYVLGGGGVGATIVRILRGPGEREQKVARALGNKANKAVGEQQG